MGIAAGIANALAANKASSRQSDAANRATDVQQGMYDQMRTNEQPFMNLGRDAGIRVGTLLGTAGSPDDPGFGSLTKQFTYQDYLNNQDPGYEFMRQQGENALINRTSTTGSALGGSALKSLMAYNQDYARTGFNDAFARYQTQQGNIFQRLSSLATLGQNAASNTGAQGTAAGANIGANLVGAGNAAAAGIIGGANAFNSGGANAAQIASMFKWGGGGGYGGGGSGWDNGFGGGGGFEESSGGG